MGGLKKKKRERKTLSGKKIILYLCGIVAGTRESDPKCKKILVQEPSNHDFVVL